MITFETFGRGMHVALLCVCGILSLCFAYFIKEIAFCLVVMGREGNKIKTE